jgi:hypothetical protein
LRAAEGRLGVDHPFGFTARRKPGGEAILLGQPFEITVEGRFRGAVKAITRKFSEPPVKV